MALLPFVLTKAVQRHKQPLWRGTLRPFVISAGLLLAAGMISLLSFQYLRDDEFGAAIFGLVVGGVITLVALFVPGRKLLREQPDSTTPDELDQNSSEARRTPVLIDASAPIFRRPHRQRRLIVRRKARAAARPGPGARP